MLANQVYRPPDHVFRKLRGTGWDRHALHNLRTMIALFPRGRLWQRVYLQLLAGGFLPSDIANGRNWYDFQDGEYLRQNSDGTGSVGDGDVIGYAEDKFGNGNNVTQAITANKPTFDAGTLNGLGVAHFDGADDTLFYVEAPTITQPWSIFLVLRSLTGIASTGNYLSNDNSQTFWIRKESTAQFSLFATGGIEYSPANYPDDTFFSMCSLWNGASSSYYTNGSLVNSGINLGAGFISGLTLASREQGFSNHALMEFAEVIIYNSLITADDVTNLFAYSSDKWGT